MNVIRLKRRAFLVRFWLSYDGHRAILGRWASCKAAWLVANSQ